MEPRYNKNFHYSNSFCTPMVFVCFLSDRAVELHTTRYCGLPCYYLTPHSVRQTMQFSEDIAAVQPNYCKITPRSASRRRGRPPSNRSRAVVSQICLSRRLPASRQSVRSSDEINICFLLKSLTTNILKSAILFAFCFFFQ